MGKAVSDYTQRFERQPRITNLPRPRAGSRAAAEGILSDGVLRKGATLSDLHSTLLESPRWPGGPPICPAVNLPALPSEKALMEFLAKNGPRCEVISIN